MTIRMLDLPVDEIIIGDRVRKNVGNVLGLEVSINQVGLLHPLVVNSRRELVAGFRRLQAVRNLGWETVPCHIVERLDDALAALKAEMQENTCRENMTPADIVEIGKRIEALEKPEAKRRQRQGGKAGAEQTNAQLGRKGAETGGGNLPQPVEHGKTRDKVAGALGVSGRTYEKAKQVKDAAEKDPQAFGDLLTIMEEKSISAAHKELKKRQKAAKDAKKPTSDTQPMLSFPEWKGPSWEDELQQFSAAFDRLIAAFQPLADRPPLEMAEAMESTAQKLLDQAATIRSAHSTTT